MEELKVHIVTLWEFRNNKNAKEIAKKICSVITDHQIQNWFSKFHSGDMSLRDEPRTDLNEDALKKWMECNPHKSTQELPLDLNTSQSIICHYLKKIEKVSKLGILIPHTLREKNKEKSIFIVKNLLSKQINDLFLKNIITDDEKWVFIKRLNHANFIGMEEGLYCVYDGITVVLFILSLQCRLILSTA